VQVETESTADGEQTTFEFDMHDGAVTSGADEEEDGGHF
jgi:hypothetical protein